MELPGDNGRFQCKTIGDGLFHEVAANVAAEIFAVEVYAVDCLIAF